MPVSSFDEVIENIREERVCQDKEGYDWWGSPHTLWEWMEVMEIALKEARRLLDFGDHPKTLQKILQFVATGVACLEWYGVVKREEVKHDRSKR